MLSLMTVHIFLDGVSQSDSDIFIITSSMEDDEDSLWTHAVISSPFRNYQDEGLEPSELEETFLDDADVHSVALDVPASPTPSVASVSSMEQLVHGHCSASDSDSSTLVINLPSAEEGFSSANNLSDNDFNGATNSYNAQVTDLPQTVALLEPSLQTDDNDKEQTGQLVTDTTELTDRMMSAKSYGEQKESENISVSGTRALSSGAEDVEADSHAPISSLAQVDEGMPTDLVFTLIDFGAKDDSVREVVDMEISADENCEVSVTADENCTNPEPTDNVGEGKGLTPAGEELRSSARQLEEEGEIESTKEEGEISSDDDLTDDESRDWLPRITDTRKTVVQQDSQNSHHPRRPRHSAATAASA